MKQLQKLALISVTLASLLAIHATAEEFKPNFNQPQCQGKKCPNKDSKRGMYHKKRGDRNPIMGAMRYLDLSKEQRTALHDLRRSHRDAMRANRQANRDKRGERTQIFIDALSKDGLNTDILLNEATKRFQEREKRRLEHTKQVIDILTPKQREELKKLLQNKMENRKDMMKEAPAKK